MMIEFGTIDGKEIGQLTTISESELISDKEPLKFSKEPITMEGKIEGDLLRAVLPQGEYNSYVMHRDGYLNPTNGWATPEKIDEFFKGMREEIEKNLI